MKKPTLEYIKSAHRRIEKYIHRTPIFSSKSINEIVLQEVYFKCENFQKAGAFKFRGACNAVFSLDEETAKKGVATHSSGNHAGALALTASMRNIPATIVMPKNAPLIKQKAVKSYGAEIIFCESNLEARENTLQTILAKTNANFIHPYNNFDVICGQGTSAIEFLEEIPNLDYILAPVGGGGLISGISTAAKAINPKIKVIGCEPKNADDAFNSFYSGVLQKVSSPNTIADGLRTSLCELTFSIIQNNVDEIITVSEESIKKAMRLVWERMKIIIEPSSAVPLAALLEDKKIIQKNKKIGIIISGGNVDFEDFSIFK